MVLLRLLTYIVALAVFLTDLVAVFVLHGLGWTLVSLVFFPITFFVAPVVALQAQPPDVLPLILTALFVVVWLIYRGVKTKMANDELRRFKKLYPLLLRATVMHHEAPTDSDGVLQLDGLEGEYFTLLTKDVIPELNRLGIYMPRIGDNLEASKFMGRLDALRMLSFDGDLETARDLNVLN